MPKTNIKPMVNNKEKSYKSICDGFDCSNDELQKIDVKAGTYGTISLNLCSKCMNVIKNVAFD